MMSCILAFYIALSGVPGAPPPHPRTETTAPAAANRAHSGTARTQPADPDALYAAREELARAREAEAIWARRVQDDPRDFEAAWKLARARYWIGGRAETAERRAVLESGIAAGRTAAAIAPDRPEGHFWIAANMGALAESFGLRQGLRYRSAIKETLLRVLEIDPAFQQGSADRALGRWYYKVPGLFGGSNRRSEEHLRRSLAYGPDSTISRYFLAETLIALGRPAEARQELQRLLDLPLDPEWAPEDKEFKARARALLDRVR